MSRHQHFKRLHVNLLDNLLRNLRDSTAGGNPDEGALALLDGLVAQHGGATSSTTTTMSCRLRAVAGWALALADEEGDLAGTDALLCAADLVRFAVADVDESDEATSAAYTAAQAQLDEALSTLHDARLQSGRFAAGYCSCGEHVGTDGHGHLRDCPICDGCSGCGEHVESCLCESDDWQDEDWTGHPDV